MRFLMVSAFAVFMTNYALAIENVSDEPVILGDESIDVAQIVINLSPGIVNDLNPPATGAERTITNATITDNANSRVYFIEGEDVYHNGRVLGTYWIRLTKHFGLNAIDSVSIATGTSPTHSEGRPMSPETHELIGPLLNVIYDIEAMSLTHAKVRLEQIVKANHEPLSFEILGVNDVCEHADLNSFKIALSRHLDEKNRPSFTTELFHPHSSGNAGSK